MRRSRSNRGQNEELKVNLTKSRQDRRLYKKCTLALWKNCPLLLRRYTRAYLQQCTEPMLSPSPECWAHELARMLAVTHLQCICYLKESYFYDYCIDMHEAPSIYLQTSSCNEKPPTSNFGPITLLP